MSVPRRVGLIVPSSNVTIETEVPRMLARPHRDGELTFHSSRAVLHSVDPESLDAMVAASDRCASELSDAAVDVVVYACLVAVMARGAGAHEELEERLSAAAGGTPVISSAGALVRTLERLGARRAAIMTPYMPALTELVAAYIGGSGCEVVDSISLGVSDNQAVGRLDPAGLLEHAGRLELDGVDVVIASACVQMPSLPVIEELEARLGLPVISAATATTAELLDALAIDEDVPGGGSLLKRSLSGGARSG
jgi:maleate isomerase